MSVMSDRQSVAAYATVTNAIVGKVHEFLPGPSSVRLYATAAAVGLNMTLIIGSESLVQDQEVSAANRFPLVPDDFVAEGFGNGGERVIVSYRNTTAGAIVAFSRVEVEALA